jgi:hypothetical protein
MEDSVKIHTEEYVRKAENVAEEGKKLLKHRELRDLLDTPKSVARRHLSSMNWMEEDNEELAMLNRYFRSRKTADKYFQNRLFEIGEPVVFYDNQVSISCDIEEFYLKFESVNDKNRIIKELQLKVEVDD